ncbi:MAG: MarR family transcriptional regulator [Rhizobiales bacterium]|jgi:DNA-binding MarR family transcriptional regulator|nr:MarR family transcriptional regulator [Hyphomicrobiales bacterium]OJU34427.1 MAG: MarR family transcriptional regulator [Rhizobiales bacterium 68-8]
MPPSPETETFGFLVTDVARLMRQEFDRHIGEAGLGLTPGEARTLSYAARAGTVRQSALAERMGVEAMTLSGYLDRLEARGLVHRTVDPADRRAKLVHLTEAAREVLARIREIGPRARMHVEAAMTPAEWETLQTLLKRARKALCEGREDNRKSSAA